MLTLPMRGYRPSATTPPALAPGAIAPRPDLDGLRGVAVLSLLAIHCVPSWSRGGLLGIDMLFVLSGFLGTAALRRSVEEGHFRYLRFLQRRVARLAPSALVVLAFCLVLAVLFAPAAAARAIGREVAWAATMLSDLRLGHEGAVASSSAVNPVLPFWAIGLVVQFSLVWPLLMRSLPGLRALRGAILIGLVASLAFALVCAARGSWLAFHPLIGRWWQFMAGAAVATLPGLLAVDARTAPQQPERWRNVVSWAAPVLLAVAGVLAAGQNVLPGAWSILPTLAVCATIAAGPRAGFNRHVLGQPVLRFYGIVAYPLVLWHWALLAIPAIVEVPVTNEVRVLVLISAVVTAALTYELIELPLRARAQASGRVALWLVAGVLGAGLLGGLLLALDGLAWTYPFAASSPMR